MNEEFLAVIGTLFGVAGLIILAIVGARLADKLYARARWLPITLGALSIVGACALLFLSGPPFGFLIRTAAVFAIGFGGGLVARERERIMRGR